MKTQEHLQDNAAVQGTTKADRGFTDQKEVKQQLGVSNGGGQRSDQTSGRDAAAKSGRKKML